jgi:hypothetical protein
MAEIPELGVALRSTGTRSGWWWFIADKIRSLEVITCFSMVRNFGVI